MRECGLLIVACLSFLCALPARTQEFLQRRTPISEPYDYVNGGSFTLKEVKASPDPMLQYVWNNPQTDDHLQSYVILPSKIEAILGGQNFSGLSTGNNEQCHIRVNGIGVLRIDFGVELPAWLEIDSSDLSGEIEMGISEYNVSELCNKIRKPIKYGNTYRLELNNELYEGVRYGFIYVNQFDREFTITGVRAVCQVKPANYTGSFDSDNELINKIWYVGAYDVRANQRQDCFGAILMDRGDRYSWTGDAYPSQAASLVAFSNYEEVLKNLKWTDSHPNNIETYELYWVESLIDYYMYSGDTKGFHTLLPQAMARLKHAYEIFDHPTNLQFVGWDPRLGAGFEHPNCQEGQMTFRMLAIGAMKHLADAMTMSGMGEEAKEFRVMAEEKSELMRTPTWLGKLAMHSSADAINAELVDDLQKLYHPDLSDCVQRLSFSPFNQCFLLKAMAKSGHYDDAFASVVDQWGGQIEYGATCFFEVYRPDWNELVGHNGPIPYSQSGFTSLAHPWGAGVTAWLTEEMLGIKPTKAGFATFNVKPHFSGMATRVSGQVNTPHGFIKASYNLKTGHHMIEVPSGTKATIAIPKEGMKIQAISMNGKRVEFLEEDHEFSYLRELGAGHYDFNVSYKGKPNRRMREKPTFITKAKSIDFKTHGNWPGKYGRDGYVIVGAGKDGSDLRQLPSYVEDLCFYQGENWGRRVALNVKPLSPYSMLPIGREVGAPKVLNCIYSAECQMSPLKVKLKYNHPYRIALYMADCDNGGRDHCIDAFDLETMNRIAPTVRVSHFNGGVYVVYEYDKSICIFNNNVRGDNAVMNAVFFD